MYEKLIKNILLAGLGIYRGVEEATIYEGCCLMYFSYKEAAVKVANKLGVDYSHIGLLWEVKFKISKLFD